MKHMPRRLFFLGLLVAVAGSGKASQPTKFEDAFVFAFIDGEFEQKHGAAPFDRSLYAQVVERGRELGAKGVVIKLFLDQERSATGDIALADAMRTLPVVLQARLEPQTGQPTELPGRFAFSTANQRPAVGGDRGWMPISRFLDVAADLGFVDFADDSIPLLETYRNVDYKSVILCALELHAGAKTRLAANGGLMIGERPLPTDGRYVQKVTRSLAPLPQVSIPDLLSGKADPASIKGRVLILGYTGRDAPILKTPFGEIEAHVFFGQCLRAVFESLQAQEKETSPTRNP